MASEHTYKAELDLVYRICETAVFAPRDLAERNHRIHRAISDSQRWREFKKAMPSEDYELLMQEQFDMVDEPRPHFNSYFSSEMVNGYLDGDYPVWLAVGMDAWIPADLLEKYASNERSTTNGDYWEIPGKRAHALAKELRARGFKVTRAEHLEFQ